MAELKPGTVVSGRYRLGPALGQGGFGSVYVAIDERDGAAVTLKFLRDTEGDRRFDVEARALMSLDHPGCLKILDVGLHGDQRFIVAEHLDGPTLRDWLSAPRSVEDRLTVALQLVEALIHAHGRGVLHRDFKPDNIIVVSSEELRACVLDFGLAKLTGVHQPDITKTGEVLGTPGFMSPEQLMGIRNVGPASDMYCLGVVLYEMFEGSAPFWGRSAFDICLQHLQNDPPTMRSAEPPLARLVAALLDKAPAARPSAGQVARELRSLLGLETPAHADVGTPAVSRRTLTMAAVAVSVVGLAIVGLLVQLDTKSSPERVEPQIRHPELVRAVPPNEPPTEPQEDPPDMGQPASLGPGCGRDLRPGRQQLSTVVGLQRRSVEAVIPVGYDPNVQHPLVIALHEGNETPDGLIRELDLVELAGRLGAVVVAPNGKPPFRGSWREGSDTIVSNTRELAEYGACIDPERVVLLGHGVGSRGALLASCSAQYTAVVLTNRQLDLGEVPCASPFPLPTLWLFVQPGFEKPEECGEDPSRMPVAGHIELWHSRNRCSGAVTKRALRHGSCRDWTCTTPLTTCEVAGGVHWRAGFGTPCGGPPSPFDYQSEIVRFLRPLLQPAQSADASPLR